LAELMLKAGNHSLEAVAADDKRITLQGLSETAVNTMPKMRIIIPA